MGDTTLGPCHYSEDMSEEATLIAVRKGGTGWIPICEEHRSDAESEGYSPQEVVDVPDAMEQNKDMPAPGADAGSDDPDHGPYAPRQEAVDDTEDAGD
jgi:hypothetical protein